MVRLVIGRRLLDVYESLELIGSDNLLSNDKG